MSARKARSSAIRSMQCAAQRCCTVNKPLQTRGVFNLPSWQDLLPAQLSAPAAPQRGGAVHSHCSSSVFVGDCIRTPSLLELAVLARQAYIPTCALRPSPAGRDFLYAAAFRDAPHRGQRWAYVWEDSYNDPAIGVHLHTWRLGESDIVITARGTELDTAAHLVGNLSLLRGARFAGAQEARGHVLRLVDRYHRRGKRIWLVGHSRGGALLQFAALPCSDAVEAVVGFESPGIPAWMVEMSRPARRDAFVDFYTYPNFITLLHPAVNVNRRYHIPTRLTAGEDTGWEHFTACVGSDLNRVANWMVLGSVFARTAATAARAVGAAPVAASAAAAGLGVVAEYTQYFRGRGLWSARLAYNDFQAAHSIDGIVEFLSDLQRGEKKVGIRKILCWPSDYEEPRSPLNALARFATDTLRNELLFCQADLAGMHHLGEGGRQAMWEARMRYLWGDWCRLSEECIEESVLLPLASARKTDTAGHSQVNDCHSPATAEAMCVSG